MESIQLGPLVRFQALPTIVRLEWNAWVMKTTLAYYSVELFTAVKGFKGQSYFPENSCVHFTVGVSYLKRDHNVIGFTFVVNKPQSKF